MASAGDGGTAGPSGAEGADRAWFRSVLEAMPAGLLVASNEGRLLEINPAGAEILGVTLDDVGRLLTDIYPELATLAWPIDRGDLRLPPRTPGQKGPVIEYSVRDVQDPDGQRAGTVVVFADITRELDRQLSREHQRRLADIGAVVASVAHEIRNPVYAISSLLHLAREEAKEHDDPEMLVLVDKIAAENRRVGRMVQDLLHFGRARDLQPEQVDVIDLVRTILEDVRSTEQLGQDLEPVPTRLELPFETRTGLVWGLDGEIIRQVLVNLLRNATRAVRDRTSRTHEQGVVVRLDLEPDLDAPETLKIEVQDHGIGMPTDVREKAFDAFFTTRSDGTGLGLAVVDRLVRKHGGRVEIESEPGAGTSIVIRLPPLQA